MDIEPVISSNSDREKYKNERNYMDQIMDIAVIHNFAEHLGGGDLVAINIIEALIEKNHNVKLYTSYPQGLDRAVKYFLKPSMIIEKTEISNVNVSRYIRHPYNIYIIAKKMFNSLKDYDLVIFFDDIPKSAQGLKKILVYAHYPHAVRIILDKLVPYKYKQSLVGKQIWKFHSELFRKTFFMKWNIKNLYIMANSTLTMLHVKKALSPTNIIKIYPPVQVEKIINYIDSYKIDKQELIVYIGRIQPEKGIETLIRSLADTKNKRIRARLIGFVEDRKYLKRMFELLRKYNLENKVEILSNAHREEVISALAHAKAIVHPADYEPFGIAVVEGMAAGCLPIVKKGLNGPWMDIVLYGRFGLGFQGINELTSLIDYALSNKSSLEIEKLIKRAEKFDEIAFKKKITEYVNRIL